MKRMPCGPWPEVIAVIAVVVGVVIAVRGWPEPMGFGTVGEWAGALFSGMASLIAIGIAWWSHHRQNDGARQTGAFEILGAKNLILSTLDQARELERNLETYVDQRQLAGDSVRHAILRRTKAEQPDFVETRIEIDGERLRARREEVREATEHLHAVDAFILARGAEAVSIRDTLDRVRHESASMFDPVFARAIVVAKGQLILVEMHARRPPAVVQAREALQVGIEQLRIAHKRTDAAEIFVSALGQTD